MGRASRHSNMRMMRRKLVIEEANAINHMPHEMRAALRMRDIGAMIKDGKLPVHFPSHVEMLAKEKKI